MSSTRIEYNLRRYLARNYKEILSDIEASDISEQEPNLSVILNSERERNRIRMKKYWAAHREELIAKKREYYSQHREEIRARFKELYALH